MKMNEPMNPFPPSPSPRSQDTPAEAAPQPEAPAAAAVMKFKSCRWRCSPEDGEFCTHRDVLPFAGKKDFKADSWCPECAFYKLRRTPKKRDWAAERAGY
jgi:hypothetical protein